MTKLRKLTGWLPAVGAMIFNSCVIGWLHCTKPQLLGSSVPGNVVAVGYTILFLLWWGAGSGRSSLPVQRAAFSVPGHAAAVRAAVCADSAPASLDSKTELAKQLAAYELAMLGVPDGTEVTVQPLDEDRLGYYSAASRQIVLSRSVLESGTAQETMDTIAHEAFHVQQTYVVENIDWDDAATQAAYYDQARRWLRNDQNGYVSGEEDILSYYFQPVEIDARAYAAEETERLQGLIDKELQKET